MEELEMVYEEEREEQYRGEDSEYSREGWSFSERNFGGKAKKQWTPDDILLKEKVYLFEMNFLFIHKNAQLSTLLLYYFKGN